MENTKKLQFAQILRNVMNETKLSQKDFSATSEISIGTLHNIFNPDYDKFPSPTVIKKIAMMAPADEREEIYLELMKLSDQNINKYPFEKNKQSNISSFLRETDLEIIISKIMYQAPIHGEIIREPLIQKNGNESLFRDLVYYFDNIEDTDITWYFDFYTDINNIEIIIKNYIFNIFRTPLKNSINKFSFVTDNPKVIDHFNQLNFESLNLILSVIYIKNESQVEEYILKTNINNNTIINKIFNS